MESYDKLARITLTGTFKDSQGNLADPTSVTLIIMAPDGTVDNFSGGDIIHDSLGVYHMNFDDHDQAGTWYYRFEGTGAVQAGGDKGFKILSSYIPVS